MDFANPFKVVDAPSAIGTCNHPRQLYIYAVFITIATVCLVLLWMQSVLPALDLQAPAA